MSGEGPKRVGVMGGSFDPIHNAHLAMAEHVREALDLEQVLFVPAGDQPLKPGEGVAPVGHRVEMVRLAIRGNPHFALSEVDLREGPSYTADTLRILSREMGGPERVALWFIVGADSLRTFPRWHAPETILRYARLAVVQRPGSSLEEANLPPHYLTRIDAIDTPLLDISSTGIRERVRQSRSIRYLVPEAVREYIEVEGLYA
jgi:nicotinate-nucleotide adenylyltransferase